MEQYWQGIVLSLLAVIVIIVVGHQNRDMSTVLTLVCCCAIGILAFSFLQPVINFVDKLRLLCKIDQELFNILMKAVGIGLVGEIAGLVCVDAGNASMGKIIQLLTTCVMLWICIPLMEAMVELVSSILGSI